MFRDMETEDLKALARRAQSSGEVSNLEVLIGLGLEFVRLSIAEELARREESDGKKGARK